MAFEEKAVRTVVEVLHDGERGFRSFGEELKEPQFKPYFIEESVTRGQYAAELERALSVESGKQVTEGGTASGAVHRAWGELKSKLGGSDHTILETAEQGEDVAKKAYEEALKVEGIPLAIRTLLQTQQTHILASHNKVKSMRDSLVTT